MPDISSPPERTEELVDGGRFWLIVTDPGCVPQRKGPWKSAETKAVLREFMKECPTALIHHLTVDEAGVPWVTHGPEWLGMLDGRSLAATTKHNRRVDEAFAALQSLGYAEMERERDCWKLQCGEAKNTLDRIIGVAMRRDISPKAAVATIEAIVRTALRGDHEQGEG